MYDAATIVEVQLMAMSFGANGAGEGEAADESEALLLSRGLHLSSPPTVQHVLEGLPLLR